MDNSRRKFSKWIIFISGLPFVTRLSSGGLPPQNKELERIAGKLLNKNSQLRDLGRHYFEHGYASTGLIEHLYLELQKYEVSLGCDPYATRFFCDLVDQEFAKGEVVSVDGWILSKAEVAVGLVAYMPNYSAGSLGG